MGERTDDGNEDLTGRRHDGYGVNYAYEAFMKEDEALKKLQSLIQHSMPLPSRSATDSRVLTWGFGGAGTMMQPPRSDIALPSATR